MKTVPNISLSQLRFCNGENLDLHANGMIVFVGPNNAGKSRALTEVVEAISMGSGRANRVVVAGVKIERQGNLSDVLNLFEDDSDEAQPMAPVKLRQLAPIGRVAESQIKTSWTNPNGLGKLTSIFVKRLGGEDRLGLAGSVPQYDRLNESPVSPLQQISASFEKEQELREAVKEALGHSIAVNRGAGSQIHLQIGELPADLADRTMADEYQAAFRAMPMVHEQGDGVKSLVGILLAVLSGQYPVVVIDEPEAFLHPPQARSLGTRLSAHASDAQVFVATHSADFLRGVLDSRVKHVTIVRLDRDGNDTRPTIMKNEALNELWTDPILRFSGVIDGVFHRGVIPCEGDADCRYYQAVLDSATQRNGRPSPDLNFVNCGGKDRIVTVVAALQALSVPVAPIVDLDYLRDKKKLQRTIELLGGDWSAFQRDYTVATEAIAGLSGGETGKTASAILNILDSATEAEKAPIDTAKIRSALVPPGDWRNLKKNGHTAVPRGDASAALVRLISGLSKLGLFLVPVGELEGWHRDVPGHGPTWANTVLQERRHEGDGPATDFLNEVVNFLLKHPGG